MNGFSKYLQSTNQSVDDFALLVKKPRETVRRWAKGIAVPKGQNMSLVMRMTDNQVTANDFYPNAN